MLIPEKVVIKKFLKQFPIMLPAPFPTPLWNFATQPAGEKVKINFNYSPPFTIQIWCDYRIFNTTWLTLDENEKMMQLGFMWLLICYPLIIYAYTFTV